MKKPVSIIVPVYNTESFLVECIESIRCQTFQNFELILVDDGSTDTSGEICDYYQKIDHRIKVAHKKNGGQNSAVREGLSITTGEYICFVDSDDYVHSQMISTLYSSAEKYNCDLVIAELYQDNKGKITPFSKIYCEAGFYGRERIEKEIFPILLFNQANVNTIPGSRCAKLFRKDAISQKAISYDSSHGEDWLVTMATIINAQSIYLHTGVYLYYYRNNPSSVTHRWNKNIFATQSGVLKFLEDEFCSGCGFDFSEQVTKHKLFLRMAALKSCQRSCRRMKLSEHWATINKITENIAEERHCCFDYLPIKERVYVWLIVHKCRFLLLCGQRVLATIRAS